MTRNRTQAAHVRDVPDSDPSALTAAYESLASAFAEQGDWRSAYEHLRSALHHARDLPTVAGVPEQHRHEVERLRHESLTDPLTGSHNRRYLDRVLPGLGSAALAMVDLDHFKDVNDRFGHDVGDRVLRHVARILRQALPTGAFCARYGGEEFVLAVPARSGAEAVRVVHRAGARVEAFPWSRVRPGLAVTVSAGVAAADGDPHTRLRLADQLLYQAKRGGRNSVAFHSAGDVRILHTLSGHRTAPHS
ncbi:diguanylate cyclase (GGDEF) domain-containing protein [Prauserella sp. Am3]|nr:diguanylate cyclase (GGDEF) domain-containing protein [Prauserella sp. Am3]